MQITITDSMGHLSDTATTRDYLAWQANARRVLHNLFPDAEITVGPTRALVEVNGTDLADVARRAFEALGGIDE